MNTWKVILATLVIFGAGVITGGLLVSYSDRAAHAGHGPWAQGSQGPRRTNPPAMAIREPRGPLPMNGPLPLNAPMHKDFLDRLGRELKLTDDQREHIGKIISDGQEKIKELSQKVEPQIHAELMETRDRIRAELTPEQQARFAELFKPAQRPRESRRGGPGRDHSATNSPAAISPAIGAETNSPAAKP